MTCLHSSDSGDQAARVLAIAAERVYENAQKAAGNTERRVLVRWSAERCVGRPALMQVHRMPGQVAEKTVVLYPPDPKLLPHIAGMGPNVGLKIAPILDFAAKNPDSMDPALFALLLDAAATYLGVELDPEDGANG